MEKISKKYAKYTDLAFYIILIAMKKKIQYINLYKTFTYDLLATIKSCIIYYFVLIKY